MKVNFTNPIINHDPNVRAVFSIERRFTQPHNIAMTPARGMATFTFAR